MMTTATPSRVEVAVARHKHEKNHAISGPPPAGHLADRREVLPRAIATTGKAPKVLAIEMNTRTEMIAARVVNRMVTKTEIFHSGVQRPNLRTAQLPLSGSESPTDVVQFA
jgi:hypothetical protein